MIEMGKELIACAPPGLEPTSRGLVHHLTNRHLPRRSSRKRGRASPQNSRGSGCMERAMCSRRCSPSPGWPTDMRARMCSRPGLCRRLARAAHEHNLHAIRALTPLMSLGFAMCYKGTQEQRSWRGGRAPSSCMQPLGDVKPVPARRALGALPLSADGSLGASILEGREGRRAPSSPNARAQVAVDWRGIDASPGTKCAPLASRGTCVDAYARRRGPPPSVNAHVGVPVSLQ